jgi:GAF domain-containing protein
MTTQHAVGAPATALSRTAQYASRAGSDADASLDNLLTVLRDIIGFQTVLVSQIDMAKSEIFIRAVQNSDPALTVPAGLEIPLTASPCQHVAHSVAPFSAADMHADANLANLPAAKEMGATSYIGVPIVLADGSFFGTLVGLDTASKEQPAEYIAWMQILAQLAALQLQRRSAARPA